MFSFYSEIVYRWKERLREYYKRFNVQILQCYILINYNFEIHIDTMRTIVVILEWINNINLIIRPLKLMKNSIDSMTGKFIYKNSNKKCNDTSKNICYSKYSQYLSDETNFQSSFFLYLYT